MSSLEHVSIVGFGGVVLWQRNFSPLRRDAVSELIENVLLEDRASDKTYTVGDYKLGWILENHRKYAVVAVYRHFLQLVFLDTLLAELAVAFAPFVATVTAKFDTVFDSLFEQFEEKERGAKRSAGSRPRMALPVATADDDDAAPTSPGGGAAAEAPKAATRAADGSFVTSSGRVIKSKDAAAPATPAGKKPVEAVPVKGGKPGKEQRQREEPVVPAARLNTEQINRDADRLRQSVIRRDAQGKEERVDEKNWSTQKRGRVSTWLRSHFGVSRELDAQDFSTIVPQLRERLIAKNVAVEVAETVCESVQTSLVGTRIGTFENLEECITRGMTDALCRILRPRREINILRAVDAAKERRKPYVIVFCGVNGVGKSTTLSKVCYWLKQNGHSVMLAAGDTFRHGAVEQLAVHARCLDVPLFEAGYGTDPSAVASLAIDQASRTGINVVLVDTAGRMQDHEPRMRALANLIHNNRPDLVLFVGEALVGNAGVDQLRKFNQCLLDFAPVGAPNRGIDGIVLTKFDTIDDKVGATVSMVYELGQPIVFVGVGQTYQDLKTIEPDVVVDSLMS